MNVFEIKPSNSIPDTLRNIADRVETGEIIQGGTGATLIINSEVFHMGTHDDCDAAVNAVFNMNVGLQKITSAALGFNED